MCPSLMSGEISHADGSGVLTTRLRDRPIPKGVVGTVCSTS